MGNRYLGIGFIGAIICGLLFLIFGLADVAYLGLIFGFVSGFAISLIWEELNSARQK